MADRLGAILSRLGVPLSQARALDLVARICGLPDWDRMRAGLVRLEGAQVPIADHALTRILRLDAGSPDLTVRAVEAVWSAHLTDHELADPALPAARFWLRAAVGASHAWACAQRTPLTPDGVSAALDLGTGRGYREHRSRPSPLLPTLLDLQAWALEDRISAPWAVQLDTCLARIPGYDSAIPLSGAPMPETFRRAAGARMRLTMRPIRELIDEVRMETETV
jgi:hypothetical protein